ncbi:alginate O-acetyltransferase AlgX-related protein [Fimbriimonas ginsengisoli]|uniref:AlgX/AlgJ SGNH hydrolase-like domain-containing protein n=1 Tax=Fimbriimonas ginsengisoli Gsoil 348 TaxID=661478 RepID=A0A068NP51_FIMGI|nr:FlgD immunoglobulin-like domain containing protein [Fimbriimonas ginsengisoli]AIE85142.1 hypothetical protein OP10G_1774 [Fimbriimonas ginsengisoli Gsoil 348]
MSDQVEVKTKRHHITREEEADRDLNGTTFSPGAKAAVVIGFLGIVFGVDIAQHVVELRQGRTPKIYQAVNLLPTKQQIATAKTPKDYWSLIPSTESIESFETELKQSSILTQALLSPTQGVLTGVFGVGNEKAYCGQPGWLFYRPDVEYLTADGFLKPSFLKARSHGAKEIQPDPVKGILDFNKQLAARNIKLIVVPMPTKPMIHPEILVGPKAEGATLQNPSFGAFKSALAQAGVEVYDPTPELLARKAQGKQYLETDTHWTPEAMDDVSAKVADLIQARVSLPPLGMPAATLKPIQISALGDIAEMLKLPKGQQIYRPQTVTTQQVLLNDVPWAPSHGADVLLLGDSFVNIFSLEGMNWGTASGFAEHLGYHLGRPIDKIAVNAGGSFASRQDLARQMYREDRLAGKKVVIYEFSMRDLSQGDWKIIPLPKPPKPDHVAPPPTVVPVKQTPIKILGVVPPAFDPTKGETAEVRLTVPKGDWRAVVVDAAGNPVVKLGEGKAEKDGDAQATWDGKGPDNKPVKPGEYRFNISGHGEDGKPVEPATASVTVGGTANPSGQLEGIAAVPATIDPAKGEKTQGAFRLPAPGKFKADVLGANRKVVRSLPAVQGAPGTVNVPWDGKDAGGKVVAPGVYTLRLRDDKGESGVVSVTVTGAKAVSPPKTSGTKPAVSEEIVVQARIAARAPSPKPGAYKDCVIALQLADIKAVSGKIGNGNMVVYVWGMQNNTVVDAAYGVGQTVTLKLTPWSKVEGKYGGFNRLELEGDAWFSWPVFWGEKK